MSLARTTSARTRPSGRTRRPPDAPVGALARRAAERIRWDRVGRVALLVTLGIVVCLYIQPALSIYNTWRAEHAQADNVHRLLRSNAALERRIASVKQPSTVVSEARALGMVRSGEKAYVAVGMPR